MSTPIVRYAEIIFTDGEVVKRAKPGTFHPSGHGVWWSGDCYVIFDLDRGAVINRDMGKRFAQEHAAGTFGRPGDNFRRIDEPDLISDVDWMEVFRADCSPPERLSPLTKRRRPFLVTLKGRVLEPGDMTERDLERGYASDVAAIYSPGGCLMGYRDETGDAPYGWVDVRSNGVEAPSVRPPPFIPYPDDLLSPQSLAPPDGYVRDPEREGFISMEALAERQALDPGSREGGRTKSKARDDCVTSGDACAMVRLLPVQDPLGIEKMLREKKAAELHYLETGEYPDTFQGWLAGLRKHLQPQQGEA